jgi:hypothetical protein
MESLGQPKWLRDRVRKPTLAFCTILLFLFFGIPAFSQLNLGRILGGITDQSGGAIVGATLTVVDVQRGVSRPLVSDEAGQYSASSLTPGTYAIRAEAKGFKSIERTDITVGVGQDIRVDLTLQPGEQTQTVTVTGEPPQINTTNAQLGGTLENQTLNELPINGRQYTHLMDSHPGVMAKPGAAGNAFLSNGAHSEQTVWMFDGLVDLNVNNGASGVIGGNNGGGGGTDQLTILPIDAIDEVNLIENPKAEYGWKTGVQVNVGLKSGTNTVHGTAFGFGRDAALDAKNPFLTPAQSKAALNLDQFGGSIGGPIKKDKLFYFGTYERQHYLVGNPKFVQLPTSAAGAGTNASFPDAIKDILTNHPATKLSQLSLNLAGCTLAGTTATCNAANGVFGSSAANASDPIALNTFGTSNNYLGKVDYHINEHNSLNGEFFYGAGAFLNASSVTQQYWETEQYNSYARVARAVWAWTPSASWVNEARFGLDNYSAPVTVAECTLNVGQPNYAQQFGFVTGLTSNPPSGCGFPVITISGFTALGGQNQVTLNHFNTYEGSDSISYTRGKHLFKFGGEIRHTLWDGGTWNNARGNISFGTTAAFTGATALEDFLAGTASSAQLLLGNPGRNLTVNGYAAFAQDDWRITPKITANLGLRYEYEPPVTDRNNLLGNFDPTAPTGLVQETGSKNVYNGDFNNFAPRLGVAWDVTGKGTTVVRAGAGIVYSTTVLLELTSTPQGARLPAIPTGFALVGPNGTKMAGPGNINVGQLSLASSQIPFNANVPIFPSSGALACGNGQNGNPATCALQAINPNFHQAYLMTWTLGLQHALTNNLSLDLAYVGTHGNQLPGTLDINQPIPGVKNGTGSAAFNEQARRPYNAQFPYLGQIIDFTSNLVSNYNSLQTSLTQRVSHGLSLTAGYTYSNTLDINPADGSAVAPVVMNSLKPALDYGTSNWDVRHHLSLGVTYVLPGKKSPGQLLEGWQINTLASIMSAFPWDAIDTGTDISGTGELNDRWDLVGNPHDFTPGGRSALPCWGVGSNGSFTGGTFAATNNCTKVAAGAGGALTAASAAAIVANMPAACVSASQSAATNPAVPLTTANATGLMSLASFGCYNQGGAVMVPPAQGTFGTMGRDVLRGKGYNQWDVSVTKNWKFKERYTLQFRTESFNLFNHPNYISGGTTTGTLSSPASFGQAASTPDGGNPVIGSGSPREIQFGMKLIF